MKAFWMDPENVVYAAESADEALTLYIEDRVAFPDSAFPVELTDQELDTQMDKHDEHGNPTSEKTNIRSYLEAAKDAGFLCGRLL